MRWTILVGVVAAAVAMGGCGGGGGSSTQAAAPVSTPATTQGTVTAETTPEKDATRSAKAKKPKAAKKKATAAAPREMTCGKTYFAGFGGKVTISAVGVACGDALAYAKRFVSTDAPQQRNLPPGWRLADCTGINDAPPTPGEPNSPRCHHGQQAFTIHFPQG